MTAATAGLLVGGLSAGSAFGSQISGGAKVAVSSISNYGRVLLKSTLESMFANLGGLGDIIKTGDHVGIKINLTGGHAAAFDFQKLTGLHPGESFWTHPEVLRAVGEIILDAGAGKITIVEAVYDEPSYNYWGYSAEGAYLGADFVDLNGKAPYQGYTVRPTAGSWFIYSDFTQNGILNDFDCVVSLAKSKRHNGAGVTHGMKNLVGTLPLPSGLYNAGQGYRAAIHDHHSYDGNTSSNLCRVVLDLNRATPINLVVNDAVMTVLGGEGPWGPPLTPMAFDTLIASKDPVAADVIATQAIGFDPGAPDGTPPFPDGLNYLTLAGQLGMGVSSLSDIEVVDTPSLQSESEVPPGSIVRSLTSFPNPFHRQTTIEFSLAASAYSTIKIYSIEGKRIHSIPSTRYPAGLNRVGWDGLMSSGAKAPAGMYLAVVEAEGSNITHKLARIN